MTEHAPLTASVTPSILARLRGLAAVKDCSVSHLVTEALERYLADKEWQAAEIEATNADVIAALRTFRRGKGLAGTSLRALIYADRRF
jgi:predicted transcriptional regulator